MEKKEIVTGRNPVIEYLKSVPDTAGMSVHISEGSHGRIIDEIISLCKKRNVRVVTEGRSFFNSYSSAAHQGVVLIMPRTKEAPVSGDVLSTAARDKGVVVLLDQITDPHNMGSIIRSAEALGCKAVIIPKNNSAAVNETVIKTAAGATAHIEIIQVTNVAQFLEELKGMGFWIIGTSDHGTVKIGEVKNILPACIIIGGEGKGMRRLTEEKCDYTVSIPLRGKVSSLNASVAAGIVIYEMLKD
ncbi:MAG TPA: 23S rRNA (guanosine(2251)-2'-O)-methyltransferase RlmB [Spirochaetota bacterium]|nr:23S rRNA (guanosine(2251)-2'-O)-methyltransferase RlmB [Spirochaetota bacterium]